MLQIYNHEMAPNLSLHISHERHFLHLVGTFSLFMDKREVNIETVSNRCYSEDTRS